MSHQTGIKANEELSKFFVKCRSGNVRVLSIILENEALTLGDHRKAKGSWEQDYDECILPLLKEKQPLYILYRLDSKSQGTYEWVLICWSPDDSPIRQKMLYASTKATLKKEFGSQISDELFGTMVDDVNLAGLKKHRTSESAPAPLTQQEEEKNEIKKLESGNDIGIDSRHQTLTGVAFPITEEALRAIYGFSEGKIQYLQLRIDIEKEEIHLCDTEATMNVGSLPCKIPESNARYHLYRFDHNYEGDYYHSVVFIYSMPGYACPIKERMLYSSSRNPIIDHLENVINLKVDKKLEIGEADELAESALLDEIHPKQNLHRPKFAKPKGPANRGAKRLTKSPKDKENESI